MTRLEFAKLNGLGNDFVIVDDLSDEISLSTEQVRSICDRHFGVGADGVILVKPPKEPGQLAYMHYINSDGTLAQMCGNGVRCFAKYLVDRGFADVSSGRLTAGTLAGNRQISFDVDADGKMLTAEVDMGCPILAPADVPVAVAANAETPYGEAYVKEHELGSPWGPFRFTCVSMGNPHAVCFIDDWNVLPDELFEDRAKKGLDAFKVSEAGAFFECHPAFPEKTNVEFASIEDDGIHMRVFERGCGETLACGTGACATLVAAVLTDRSGCASRVHLLGGPLDITWDDGGSVMMTGPAEEAFSGVLDA